MNTSLSEAPPTRSPSPSSCNFSPRPLTFLWQFDFLKHFCKSNFLKFLFYFLCSCFFVVLCPLFVVDIFVCLYLCPLFSFLVLIVIVLWFVVLNYFIRLIIYIHFVLYFLCTQIFSLISFQYLPIF